MVSGNIQEGMQELKAYTDARVAATEVKVQALQATTDEHSKQLIALQNQMAAMQASQTATASSVGKLQEAVADEVNGSGTIDPDYARAPNFGILRIGTAQKANKSDIIATVEQDWL
eukprot:10065370-Karenia_brevis.AAC.1